MHPIAQEFLISASRTHRSTGYDVSSSSTIAESFRRSGAERVVTLAALGQGFGPGWTAEEVCQLALQAVRNEFVEAGSQQSVDQILRSGLQVANRAVFVRAESYQAVEDIGVWLMVVVIVGSRCYVAQVGGGVMFSQSGNGETQRIYPGLVAVDPNAFLGQFPDLELVPSAGDVSCLDLERGGQVLLANTQLGRLWGNDQVSRALSRMNPERAADRLIKASQTKEFDGEAVLLLVQMPGADQKRSRLPRYSWVVLPVVAVVAGAVGWLSVGRPEKEPAINPEVAVAVTASSTVTLKATTAVPTAQPTATPEPIVTDMPTLTPKPTRTLIPLTSTPKATATETSTPTPIPPTATFTLTPSPTIPAAPIAVGGRVVIVNTEGLGVSFREGPSTLFNRLLTLRDGDRLVVIGGPEQGPEGEAHLTWWQLRTENGVEGWAVDRFLQGVAP